MNIVPAIFDLNFLSYVYEAVFVNFLGRCWLRVNILREGRGTEKIFGGGGGGVWQLPCPYLKRTGPFQTEETC